MPGDDFAPPIGRNIIYEVWDYTGMDIEGFYAVIALSAVLVAALLIFNKFAKVKKA